MDNTKIIIFKDDGKTLFTMKKGKSYNITKYDRGFLFPRFYIRIINCVSGDILNISFSDKNTRDSEYDSIKHEYLEYNNYL